MFIKKYVICLVTLLTALLLKENAFAQNTPATAARPIVKFKPPVVTTSLGTVSGNNAVAELTLAKNLLSQPLKITDPKGGVYTIASYHFTYKRIGITEDEETGKTSPQTDIVSRQFETTPLPDVWQTNISESLHTGESLHFFDIIVLDKAGRRFFAPQLKITIE
jgi:hypothetical protein